jgi:hypothetical protein
LPSGSSDCVSGTDGSGSVGSEVAGAAGSGVSGVAGDSGSGAVGSGVAGAAGSGAVGSDGSGSTGTDNSGFSGAENIFASFSIAVAVSLRTSSGIDAIPTITDTNKIVIPKPIFAPFLMIIP